MGQGQRSKGLRELSQEFAKWTSANGLPHIWLSLPFWLTLVWLLITAGSTAGFLYQLIFQLIRNYFSYPVNVNTQNTYSPRPFPAVTFCFLNPWKITQISGTPLNDLVYAYLNDKSNNEKYGFTLPSTTMWEARAIKWMNFMYEELKELDETTNTGMSYSFDDLFISCTYNGNNCNQSDFDMFYDPFYGRCYTFNKNGTYTSTRASPNYGLRVQIRINLIEFLPWTTSAGVKTYIHNQDQSSLVNTFGYFLPVAKASSLGIRALSRQKLLSPYSDCVNKNPRQSMYHDGEYDLEMCLRNCVQDMIIAKCGCYDPTYNWPSDTTVGSCYSSGNGTGNSNVTDPNMAIDCIWSITNTDGLSGNPYENCECPEECNDQTYRVTMSNAFWPMQKYKPTECIVDAYAPSQSNGYDIWNQPIPNNIPTLNRGQTTGPPQTTPNQPTTLSSSIVHKSTKFATNSTTPSTTKSTTPSTTKSTTPSTTKQPTTTSNNAWTWGPCECCFWNNCGNNSNCDCNGNGPGNGTG